MDDRGRNGPALSAAVDDSPSPAATPADGAPSAGRDTAQRVARAVALPAVVVVVVLALLAVVWTPAGLRLDVGQPGDRLFLSGVHGDERADGRAYRWTRGDSVITVPGIGGVDRLRLTLQAESGRPGGAAVTLPVRVDGTPAGSLSIGANGSATLDLDRTGADSDVVTVALTAPTFRPAGDARDLGVLLDAVALEPTRVTPSLAAPAERWLRVIALFGVAALALWPVRRWWPAPVLVGLAGGVVVLAAALWAPWLLALWPWLMAGLAAAALVTNWAAIARPMGAATRALDRRWAWAAAVMVLVAGYVVVMTALAAQIEWIGHADYADNAVVARNLVQGRGLSVDYAAQFYADYGPEIRHPSDVWPLLQPALIAGAFLLLGPTTFAAKLPNIVAMAALLALTAWVGRRFFGGLVGLGAAIVLALDGWFFTNTLFPVNDIPFTLLAMVAVLLAVAIGAPRAEQVERSSRIPWLCAGLGLCGGLLVVAKPGGALLLGGLAVWLGWRWWRGVAVRPAWRWLVVIAGLVALVVAPVVTRNLLTFGQPFFSLQSYDAWVTKWEPPDENIYRLMAGDLPHPRRLVGLGFDRAAEALMLQWRRLWTDLADGTLIEVPLLVLAAVGLVGGGALVRRTLAAVAAATAPYLLFVMVYWHYEQRYLVYLTPWLVVLAVGGVAVALRWASTTGVAGRRLAMATLVVGAVLLIVPRVQEVAGQVARLTPPAGDVIVGEWLAANTPPETVIMTRVPWQTTWHSNRRTVMIPLAPAAGIADTIRHYGVDYLVVNRLEAATRRRDALAPLYDGREALGFTRVMDFTNPLGQPYATIYRVPASMREAAR